MEGIEVRWGRPEDEIGIAELLELNGMPRWAAFEERFIVAASPDGEILAALRYRTASKRLLLGMLVADPWAGERALAGALYSGARDLAREMGVREVLAGRYGDYPDDAGYGWGRGGGRLDVGRVCEGLPAGGWRRVFALVGVVAVPFFRAFPPREEGYEFQIKPLDYPTPKSDSRR
ncbi:hypothetical protein BH24ACT19_BH24ACT19_08630 [soil metagenome]